MSYPIASPKSIFNFDMVTMLTGNVHGADLCFHLLVIRIGRIEIEDRNKARETYASVSVNNSLTN